MKLIIVFLRLVRWPNLVFIALTQLLFVYCIVHPGFYHAGISPNIYGITFILLCVSSLLVAAGGYIINDYFDLHIDKINKPDKLVVEKIISRRWVIIWHLLLSISGVAIGFYLDFTTSVRFLGLSNFICVVLLFIYSASLKRQLLSGNILIAFLAAWVILLIALCETSTMLGNTSMEVGKIIRLTFIYAGFAFITSLIREVVKDMEDIEGDRQFGCRTMPIVWGITTAKVFVTIWTIVLTGILAVLQFYALVHLNWWIGIGYCTILILLPLLHFLRKFFSASSSTDYHKLSSIIKLVMLVGIISMLLWI